MGRVKLVPSRIDLLISGQNIQTKTGKEWLRNVSPSQGLHQSQIQIHQCQIKGSVERSLLPSAIFLIFTRNRPWMFEDHLCTLFFIEMSKERLEKSKRTPPVLWHPLALAYSRDRPYNFSCLSVLSKNGRLRSFFSALGCHLAKKSLSWPAMPVSNKNQEFEQRKRIKLFDDFWVRAYRFDFAPRRRPRARSM